MAPKQSGAVHPHVDGGAGTGAHRIILLGCCVPAHLYHGVGQGGIGAGPAPAPPAGRPIGDCLPVRLERRQDLTARGNAKAARKAEPTVGVDPMAKMAAAVGIGLPLLLRQRRGPHPGALAAKLLELLALGGPEQVALPPGSASAAETISIACSSFKLPCRYACSIAGSSCMVCTVRSIIAERFTGRDSRSAIKCAGEVWVYQALASATRSAASVLAAATTLSSSTSCS